MKCFVEKEIMRPAIEALLPPPHPADGVRDHMDMEGMLRAEASGKRLLMQGPCGQAEVPARVEEPGVLFLAARSFVDTVLSALDETYAPYVRRIEIDTSRKPFGVNIFSFLEQPEMMALYPDPASAPLTWEPPPEPVEEDFDGDVETEVAVESLGSDAD